MSFYNSETRTHIWNILFSFLRSYNVLPFSQTTIWISKRNFHLEDLNAGVYLNRSFYSCVAEAIMLLRPPNKSSCAVCNLL